MSEGDWSSEARGIEPPKRRVPLWVWGCGGGCALFLLVAVILGVGSRWTREQSRAGLAQRGALVVRERRVARARRNDPQLRLREGFGRRLHVSAVQS